MIRRAPDCRGTNLRSAEVIPVGTSRIIRHHHEKFDGSGYPDQLRGEDIPVAARVLQIVDA